MTVTLQDKIVLITGRWIGDRQARRRGLHPGNAIERAEAAFLASDPASFITGVILPVGSGWSVQLV